MTDFEFLSQKHDLEPSGSYDWPVDGQNEEIQLYENGQKIEYAFRPNGELLVVYEARYDDQ